MKKSERFRFGAAMAMAVALIFYAGSGAWAQLDTDVPFGHLKVQTALETDWGVSTAGKPNRNNDNNHIPGSGQGLSTDGDDLQSANGRVEPLITLRISDDAAQSMWLDDADAYVHLRYWADVAQLINGPRVNTVGQGDYATPGVSRYPGDAWAARISEHEYEADAAEAYIDLRKGPLALRLGKQQIVYGEELGLQTLDQVDSLDFTRSSPGVSDRFAGVFRRTHCRMDGQALLPASGFRRGGNQQLDTHGLRQSRLPAVLLRRAWFPGERRSGLRENRRLRQYSASAQQASVRGGDGNDGI